MFPSPCQTSAPFVYLVTITEPLFVIQWKLICVVRGACCYKSLCKGQTWWFVFLGSLWDSE